MDPQKQAEHGVGGQDEAAAEREVEWDFLHGLTMELDKLHPACATSFLIVGVAAVLIVAAAVVIFSADTASQAAEVLVGIIAAVALVVVPIAIRLRMRREKK